MANIAADVVDVLVPVGDTTGSISFAADVPMVLIQYIYIPMPRPDQVSPYTDAGRFGTEPDFGTDLGSYPSIDFRPRNSRRNVADALYRRFTTPRAKLKAHPDYGFDLRAFLNETITDDVLVDIKTACEREAEKDERVLSIDVAITFSPTTQILSIKMEILTAEGPFSMVLTVSSLSIEMLFKDRG